MNRLGNAVGKAVSTRKAQTFKVAGRRGESFSSPFRRRGNGAFEQSGKLVESGPKRSILRLTTALANCITYVTAIVAVNAPRLPASRSRHDAGTSSEEQPAFPASLGWACTPASCGNGALWRCNGSARTVCGQCDNRSGARFAPWLKATMVSYSRRCAVWSGVRSNPRSWRAPQSDVRHASGMVDVKGPYFAPTNSWLLERNRLWYGVFGGDHRSTIQ